MVVKTKNLIVVGAGEAGVLLLNEIKKNPLVQYKIKGFVDDLKKKGEKIGGYKVIGQIKDVPRLVHDEKVDEIIVAIPSIKSENLHKITAICEKTGVETKILPSTYEALYSLKTGKPWYGSVREIRMEDLIKRKPVLIDFNEIKEFITDRTILITGAGGSIGSELCKQICELNPKKLIALDNCEYNLYSLEQELLKKYQNIEVTYLLLDIKDGPAIRNIFQDNVVDIVFHSAAYKHVPLLEVNKSAAIKNNVFGTYNVAKAASDNKVKSFVLISTDKAVNPSSFMGATKRICENVVKLVEGKTAFTTVRFGNVLGSTGSVIPLFEKQIENGGPVTITHPKMTRFFMTISEAVQLVIQSGALGKKGDLFVLDMGQPHKIVDVAKRLIRLRGYNPGKDIKIKYIGVRPGEKIHEKLFTEKERLNKTKNQRIFLTKPEEINKKEVQIKLDSLRTVLLGGGDEELINIIKDLVPSYKSPISENLNPVKKPRVLVTGATGYLGSNLCEGLKRQGIEVIEASLSKGCDLLKKEDLEKILQVDIVFHLASLFPKNKEDVLDEIRIMRNVLEFCEKHKSMLIFASSSAIYGRNKSRLNELAPLRPVNYYGEAKMHCEKLFFKSNVKGVIFRIFNMYGGDKDTHSWLVKFVRDVNTGEVDVFEGVSRDFVHVDDVVEAFLKSLSFKGNKNVFNIGSGRPYYSETLVKNISKVMKKRIKINYVSPPKGLVDYTCADITKAKKFLDWTPKIDLIGSIGGSLK